MSTIYLSSVDGSDADNGSTWALAKATLAAALTAAGAGGTVYVADAHAETQASAMTLTSPGTAASPVNVICVTRGADVTPPTAVATTATVTTTSTSSITGNGNAYFYGITFNAGTGAGTSSFVWGSSSGGLIVFESCAINLLGTSTSSLIQFSSIVTTWVKLNNTTVRFGAVGQSVQMNLGRFHWSNTASAVNGSGSTPTSLFTQQSSGFYTGTIWCYGCDFSNCTNVVNVSAAGQCTLLFENCKIPSSLTTGSVSGPQTFTVSALNCDNGNTNYKFYFQNYQGTVSQETTIVRTTPQGAYDGTRSVSRKMVSSANTKFANPLVSADEYGKWTTFWNNGTSSITVGIATVTDNVTLTNADCWVEVEYLGTSGFPESVIANSRAANILTTPANQPTDGTSVWTTTGLTTPVQQVMSCTVTPASKGMCRARLCLAKASTTVYYDPGLNVA